ncbi:hypothetical protein Vretimale_35 [Volvox reticuliferus]|uniref:Uncharacterized protein n=1 Tax=Volvox reticuliferus TaxID=1737510 RepID=A0A8J4G297_9CHLO|nr:hypothetical protein Vretimale_35 [Volvox reticuliferus]
MGRSKARSRLLSCFGCGTGGPSRIGSEVAVSKANNGPLDNHSFINSSSDSAKCASESVPEMAASRAPTAGSARRPSYAFAEPAQQGSSVSDTPDAKVSDAAISVVPAAAAAAVSPSGGDSACREAAFAARRQPRKPRIRTSRVAPAFDTEDELSPAAGVSRTPSGSAAGSSSRAYSASFPPLEPPLEEDAVEDADTNVDPDSAALLSRGLGGGGGGMAAEVTAEEKAGGGDAVAGGAGSGAESSPADGLWLQPATAEDGRCQAVQVCEWDPDADRDAEEHIPYPGAVCTASFRTLASPKSAAVAAESDSGVDGVAVRNGSGSAHSRAPTMLAARAAAAPAHRNDSASRRNGSRGGGTASRISTADVAGEGGVRTGSSRSSSGAARHGAGRDGGRGCGAVDTAAAANPATELSFPGPDFARRSGVGTSPAASAISPAAAADSGDLIHPTGGGGDGYGNDGDGGGDGGDGGDGRGCAMDGGGGGNGTAARRNSFAGDSSTSLVGPGMVSETTQLQHCPSLRLDPGSPKPAEMQQTLAPCESLSLSPNAPVTPPLTLQTCGSLRLTPLSRPRPLAPSPSLRPTPLLLPSPSLSRNESTPTLTTPPTSLQQLLLPPGGVESAPAKVSPAGDTMLRLPPPQPPLFQHSPCSLTRSSYPRANALAPLVRTSVPGDNSAALNRLASLQAAFREHQSYNTGQQEEKVQFSFAATALQEVSSLGGVGATDVSAVAQNAVDGPSVTSNSPRKAAAATAVAITKATEAAAGGCNGGGGGGAVLGRVDDGYVDECFRRDVVDSMVGHLVPPSSSYRSSAPAVPFDQGQYTKNESLRRTASVEKLWPSSPAVPNHSSAMASLHGGAAGKAELGLVSEPASEQLERYAPKWLEELLPPPSPGYKAQRPSAGAAADSHHKRLIVAAPDSFRSLMREIE